MSEADSKHPVTCFKDILKVERKMMKKQWNFLKKLKQDYGNVGLQVRKCRVDSGFWWNMYILVHACMCKRGWLLHHNHSYDATQYQTHVGTSLPVLLGCHQSLDGLIVSPI